MRRLIPVVLQSFSTALLHLHQIEAMLQLIHQTVPKDNNNNSFKNGTYVQLDYI